MSELANELWELFKTVDSTEEQFRTHVGIPYFYKLTNTNLIIIYCQDELGYEEKCYFTKDQFLEVANIVANRGELLDKSVYIRELQNKDFSKNVVAFLFPIVHYIAEYFLNRTEAYKIVAVTEETRANSGIDEKSGDEKASDEKAFVIEAAVEENISVDDAEKMSKCRTVRFHPRMESYYKKTTDDIRKQIDDVCRMFSEYGSDECLSFLKQSNNKRLSGSSKKIDKIYMNRHSSGHRLLWCKGEDVDKTRFAGEIILLDYVETHDEQGKVADRLDLLNANYSEAVSIANTLSDESKSGFVYSIPPYKYKSGILLPVLSDKQKSMLMIEPPAMMFGGAGTGKTQVSIYLFHQLYEAGKEPLYVTYTESLTRNVRDQLIDLGCEASFVYSHVFMLSDYFNHLLKRNDKGKRVVEFDDYVAWKKTVIFKKSETVLKEIDDWLAWTYIRGVIKGGAVELGVQYLPRQEFVRWMNKNESISETISTGIYELAERFDKYCKMQGLFDDNDLAWEVLDRDIKGVNDAVIIDEVQDLTYLHIMALKDIAANGSIYMCGDINQRINPTIIDLNSIGKVFFGNSSNNMQVLSLGSSYRVGSGIIRFVNNLSDLRREYIGKQNDEAEIVETSSRSRDQGMWVNTCDSKTVSATDLCDLVKDAANSIVLVPDTRSKDEILKCRPKMEGRVRTIFEVKGLEYDNVILMNFVSEYQKLFDDIFAGNLKRNTYARLLFNMIYVGCTRAKERLIIYEKNSTCASEKMISKSAVFKKSVDDIRRFIDLKNDDEGWKTEAIRLEELGDYRSALLAYEHIEGMDIKTDLSRCTYLSQYEDLRRNNSKISWIDVYDIVHGLIEIDALIEAERVIREISVDNETNQEGMSIFLLEILHRKGERVEAKHIKDAVSAGIAKNDSIIAIIDDELKKNISHNENLLAEMKYLEV